MEFIQDGDVALFSRGPNSNNSQFMITFRPLPVLNRQHVVIGTVLKGMKVIRKVRSLLCRELDYVIVSQERVSVIVRRVCVSMLYLRAATLICFSSHTCAWDVINHISRACSSLHLPLVTIRLTSLSACTRKPSPCILMREHC